jgi:ketosteroid isomerase-like protein
MKRSLLVIATLFITQFCTAQKAIDEMINAERSFAKFATDVNTRGAFLKYMDSTAVMFNKGEVQKAVPLWTAKKPNKAKLIWEPAFAVLSSGKDIGVTTGPWEFRLTMDDTALARGCFTTVWHKTNTGEWKWLVDIGSDHSYKPASPKEVVKIQLPSHAGMMENTVDGMLKAENNLIEGYDKIGNPAFLDVIDKDTWFNTQGQLPVRGELVIKNVVDKIPAGLSFTVEGSGMGKDGDLGYVYGIVSNSGKKENYLRVWKREANNWYLILQTLLF